MVEEGDCHVQSLLDVLALGKDSKALIAIWLRVLVEFLAEAANGAGGGRGPYEVCGQVDEARWAAPV